MTDVWIDTDPSIGVPFHEADDGFALIQAFHSPNYASGHQHDLRQRRSRHDHTDRLRNGPPLRRPRRITDAHVFAGAASARDLGKPTAATEALRAALAERR